VAPAQQGFTAGHFATAKIDHGLIVDFEAASTSACRKSNCIVSRALALASTG
jgi:hypothetical protein